MANNKINTLSSVDADKNEANKDKMENIIKIVIVTFEKITTIILGVSRNNSNKQKSTTKHRTTLIYEKLAINQLEIKIDEK